MFATCVKSLAGSLAEALVLGHQEVVGEPHRKVWLSS